MPTKTDTLKDLQALKVTVANTLSVFVLNNKSKLNDN
jgi:hypothetical protein